MSQNIEEDMKGDMGRELEITYTATPKRNNHWLGTHACHAGVAFVV